MTSALISVESAAAMSFAMRFLLCDAHRLTYRARRAPDAGVSALAAGGGVGATDPAASFETSLALSACSAAVEHAAANANERRSKRMNESTCHLDAVPRQRRAAEDLLLSALYLPRCSPPASALSL